MTPETYARLKELFQQATDLATGERTAFLNRECGDDGELRRELEELLSHDAGGAAIVEQLSYEGVANRVRQTLVGRTINQYQIAGELGRGGMGSVYRAEDTRLGRAVALKFLAPHLAQDETFSRRFLREAKAAATLDHPNICTVFEIAESDFGLFIAMPFLDGKTLRARIEEGPVRISTALDYAAQIAAGLEAAHTKGVVHRDIKPENVMVLPAATGSRSSLLKILDFGVAQWSGQTTLTGASRVPGTLYYMSPEQVKGEDTDARTDIWAAGALLYEMVAGRKPFRGESDAVAQSVLFAEPDPLTAVRSDVPMELERITFKCLAKQPEERYQSATDLLVDLRALWKLVVISSDSGSRRLSSSTAMSPLRTASLPAGRRFSTSQVVAACLLVGLGVGALVWHFGAAPPPTEFELKRITFDGGLSIHPALSPDGKFIAYASDRAKGPDLSIWLQQADGGGHVQLTHHPSDEYAPSFSADGTQMVFFRNDPENRGIYLISALGGKASLLIPKGEFPVFSPDGQKILYKRNRRLFVSSVDNPSPVAFQPEFETFNGHNWTPDGGHVIFVARSPELERNLWVSAVDGGEAWPVYPPGETPYFHGWPSLYRGGLLFALRGGLWHQPISTSTWKATGPKKLVALGAGLQPFGFSAAAGAIAFSHTDTQLNINRLAVNPNDPTEGEAIEPLTSGYARTISSDVAITTGAVVYTSNSWGNQDVWTADPNGSSKTNLTPGSGTERYPVISPDGSLVAYERLSEGVYTRPLSGGHEEKICEHCSRPTAWSPDNKLLLVRKRRDYAVYALDIESGEEVSLLAKQGHVVNTARFSPDGRWISFSLAPEAGAARIFVAPFEGQRSIPEARWIQITRLDENPEVRIQHPGDVDDKAAWSPNGEILYFLSSRDGSTDIWYQRLDPSTKRSLGEPVPLQHFPRFGRSMELILPPNRALGVGPQGLVFPFNETTGDIWMMVPPAAN